MINNNANKALPFIAMAYVTVKLIALLLFYKVITIFSVHAAASTLVIPLWFCIGDVITEVYGYNVAKKLVFATVFCQLIFGWLPGLLNFLPSTSIPGLNQFAYKEVIGNLPRGATASFLAIAMGGIVNAFILNKWKVLLNGKYFFIRSLGSTAIGELVFTICVYFIGFQGLASGYIILKLILVSFFIKFTVNPLMIGPISILTGFLKRYENRNRLEPVENVSSNPKFTMLYSKDGKSYFKEKEFKLSTRYSIGLYSKNFPVESFCVRNIDEGQFLNWHTIQQSQYTIYLSGEIEIEASGGEVKRFKMGDIVFFNDLTGQGHITRIISSGQAIIIQE